jgi:hypothetical protein
MSIISAGGAVTGAGGVDAGYQIERSLRFNSADSAYLNRTPASASNRKTWTWSFWYKRSAPPTGSFPVGHGTLFGGGYSGAGATQNDFTLSFSEGVFSINNNVNNANVWRLVTTQVFRDVSAWYHIIVALDSTQATDTNRVKLYVNGAQVTAFSTATYPTQNYDSLINTNLVHRIGAGDGSGSPNVLLNGNLAEVHFVDGQQLSPTDFGEFNSDTGVWQPIEYTGTYGTNGFYLPFSDNASTTTLGEDQAGSNDWTTNNFSVTAGAGNDSLVDSPTRYGTDTGAGGEVRGNYATLNPLDTNSNSTLSNGNLNISKSAASWGSTRATFGMSSGKWYLEYTCTNDTTNNANGQQIIGIGLSSASLGTYTGSDANGWGYSAYDGKKYNNQSGGTGTGTAYGSSWTNGDVIGIAFDADVGTLTFYKNGVSQGNAYTGLASGTYFPMFGLFGSDTTATGVLNCGQRPFAYTAPSGFKALVTTNLPTPTIEDGGEYFNTVLYTGTGSSQSITGVGFQPDWVWIKERNAAADHGLYDAVRGVQNQLESNTTTAETAEANGLTAFGTDGFTVGSLAQLNTSADTYVAWNWKANGAGVSNTDGTITSTVSANTDAGFSIVNWTGSLSFSAQTVGHGLGVAPHMVILKNRDVTDAWFVFFSGITSTSQNLYLNTTAAVTTQGSALWGAGMTSSVVGVRPGSIATATSNKIIMYCFAPVAGYSAFGSYTGNGSNDGVFVYTGFRPRWILVKRTDSTSGWHLYDTSRDTYNAATKRLQPDLSNAENTANGIIDILSNGWKFRNTNTDWDASGGTYIYAAFAENPFSIALAR